jgi:hypothetical protein
VEVEVEVEGSGDAAQVGCGDALQETAIHSELYWNSAPNKFD